MKVAISSIAEVRSQFHRAVRGAYLDTAAEGLPPDSARESLLEYLADKTSGSPGRGRMFAAETAARAATATLLNTSPENVAFVGNATDGLNLLSGSIRWSPGDEVLMTDLEFSSNVVSWLRLEEQGVHVLVIPSHSGKVELEDFVSRIGPRTKVVTVSQVSYKSGTQFPFLSELARETHRAGGILVVDATQSLGRVPVSVEGVDFLAASSYKWLLGTHGLGVIYCAPELTERLKAGAAGWYSIVDVFAPDRFEHFHLKPGAGRFAGGMPNFGSIYVLRDSLQLLAGLGIEAIDSALKPLVEKARKGIESLGYSLLTPSDPRFASGIVSFAHPAPEGIGQALAKDGVVVWAGDGRVRTSIHLYNNDGDIHALLESLARAKDAAPAAKL